MCVRACVQRGRAEASGQGSSGPCLHAVVQVLYNHLGKLTREGKGDHFAAHQGSFLVDRGFQDSGSATGTEEPRRGVVCLWGTSAPHGKLGEVHPGAEWGFLPHGIGSQLCFCSFAFKEKLQNFP